MQELLLVGLAPLVEQLTSSLKNLPYVGRYASLLSLIVGYVLVYALTQDATQTLLVGSALGGTASAFHKAKKYVDQVELGEPEVGSVNVE